MKEKENNKKGKRCLTCVVHVFVCGEGEGGLESSWTVLMEAEWDIMSLDVAWSREREDLANFNP